MQDVDLYLYCTPFSVVLALCLFRYLIKFSVRVLNEYLTGTVYPSVVPNVKMWMWYIDRLIYVLYRYYHIIIYHWIYFRSCKYKNVLKTMDLTYIFVNLKIDLIYTVLWYFLIWYFTLSRLYCIKQFLINKSFIQIKSEKLLFIYNYVDSKFTPSYNEVHILRMLYPFIKSVKLFYIYTCSLVKNQN